MQIDQRGSSPCLVSFKTFSLKGEGRDKGKPHKAAIASLQPIYWHEIATSLALHAGLRSSRKKICPYPSALKRRSPIGKPLSSPSAKRSRKYPSSRTPNATPLTFSPCVELNATCWPRKAMRRE